MGRFFRCGFVWTGATGTPSRSVASSNSGGCRDRFSRACRSGIAPDRVLEPVRVWHWFSTSRQVIPAEIARQRAFPRIRCWIDLVVVGQIGEAFEDAEQLLVPGSAPDLHIARPARRAEWPELRKVVATLNGEAAEGGAHQMKCLALAGLPRVLAEPDADPVAVAPDV
jgi:hypothetical protein